MKQNTNGDVEVESIEPGDEVVIRDRGDYYVVFKLPKGDFLVVRDLRGVGVVEFASQYQVVQFGHGYNGIPVSPGAFLEH